MTGAREHRNPRIAGILRLGARAPAEREDRAARVADDLLVDARVAQAEAHDPEYGGPSGFPHNRDTTQRGRGRGTAHRSNDGGRGTGNPRKMVETGNYHAPPWRRSDASWASCAPTAAAC